MAKHRDQSKATDDGTVLVYNGDLFKFHTHAWSRFDNPLDEPFMATGLCQTGLGPRSIRYRNDDGSAPEDYQSGCVVVGPTGLHRWNERKHTWEMI